MNSLVIASCNKPVETRHALSVLNYGLRITNYKTFSKYVILVCESNRFLKR